MPMSFIKLRGFGGMIPRRGDQKIPDNMANDAENCLLLSGELQPLHKPSLLRDFFPPATHKQRLGSNGGT